MFDLLTCQFDLFQAGKIEGLNLNRKESKMKKGQLWQECFCGTEPVCVDCEKCKRHCRCDSGKPDYKIDLTCAEPYRRGIGQGFGSTEDGQEE